MAATSPFASPNEPGQRRADRRDLPTGTLTLLFTDIQGSTYLLQQLGEHYASVLSECRDLQRAAFAGHHGHEPRGLTQQSAHHCACGMPVSSVLAR